MNCHESRTVLDAAFPDSGSAQGTDFEQARSHARSCSECSSWLQSAETFDRWVAPTFRDTQIPEGLRDRLLQALDAERPAVTPLQAVKSSRRKWLGGVTVAVAMALVVGWWNRSSAPVEPTQLALADVEEQLDAQAGSLQTLAAFDGRFAPTLPGGWGPKVAGSPLGIDLDGNGGHDAAVYRFTSGQYSGYLVVIDSALISDPPSVSIPHRSNADYRMQRVAWTSSSSGQVCICYLDADGPRLDEFLRDLYPASA
jgi:hypothetical protein